MSWLKSVCVMIMTSKVLKCGDCCSDSFWSLWQKSGANSCKLSIASGHICPHHQRQMWNFIILSCCFCPFPYFLDTEKRPNASREGAAALLTSAYRRFEPLLLIWNAFQTQTHVHTCSIYIWGWHKGTYLHEILHSLHPYSPGKKNKRGNSFNLAHFHVNFSMDVKLNLSCGGSREQRVKGQARRET